VTEQTEVEAVLLQSEALYRVFLEQSPMGILHLDAAGVVTFENHAFRQIVGEGVEDAWIGRHPAAIPGLEPHLKPLISRMLEDGTPLRGAAATYRRRGASAPSHLVVHGSPIRQPGGAIVGGVMMIEDVTEARRRADELRLRDRYVKAETALREAVLADLNETVFVHEAAAILGETAGADRVHVLIHLGDEGHCATRAVWTAAAAYDSFSLYIDSGLYPALRDAVVNGRSLHLRLSEAAEGAKALLRLTEAEEVIWMPFFDAGRLGGFVLLERIALPDEAWPAVEHRLIERLVRLFEALWSWVQVGQRYRLTVATIEDCLFTFSFDAAARHYLFITPQIKALTGYGAEAVLAGGRPAWWWLETLVHPDDRDAVRAHDETLRHGRKSRLVYRVRHADGGLRWLSEYATPHHDAGRITVSGILTDVTEQKDAEEILLNAREQVASASRLKNTFVATMSHELRTPLGALNGFADLLTDELAEWEGQTGATLPPQIHEFTEAVRQNARRLLMLADDLFVLSNMESGALRLEQAAVLLHPLVRRAADAVALHLREKNVALQVDLVPADLVVLGDACRLEQVLNVLLSNAVKFTDTGRVAVSTRRSGNHILLEVADTGIGISREHLGKLFTPFLQEDDRLNRRYDGTGLGLALAKRLLDLMNGRIEVASEKGRGTVFRVFLSAAEDGVLEKEKGSKGERQGER
jgi:PAS domain S-box-containing protein